MPVSDPHFLFQRVVSEDIIIFDLVVCQVCENLVILDLVVCQPAGIKSVDLVNASVFHAPKACHTMWSKELDLLTGAAHSSQPPGEK